MQADIDYFPKLACLCCTYLRPNLLENAIESFRRQDYPKDRCELIVLDDADQYRSNSQENWRVVSIARRYRTLGDKRNACANLSSRDVDAYVIWDDDDIYLPHTLQAHSYALSIAPWSRPSMFLHEHADGRLQARPTGGLFHAAWALSRDLFERYNGYLAMNTGEDAELMNRMINNGVQHADPCVAYSPYFIHRWVTSGCWHISALGPDGYDSLEKKKSHDGNHHTIKPFWPKDYSKQAKAYLADNEFVQKVQSSPKRMVFATSEQVDRRREVCGACSQQAGIEENSVSCRASTTSSIMLDTGRCKLRKWEPARAPSKPVIYCDVFEGLSNRFNAIASALATEKEVYLRWAVNVHCPMRFDEIFKPIPGLHVVSEEVGTYPYEAGPDRLCWYYARNVMQLRKDIFRQKVYQAYRLLWEHMLYPKCNVPALPAVGLHFRHYHQGAGEFDQFINSAMGAISWLQPEGIYIATDSGEHRDLLAEKLAAMPAKTAWSDGPLLKQDLKRSKKHVVGFIQDLRALAKCRMGIITNSTCSSATDILRGFGIHAYATYDDEQRRYGGHDDLFERRMVSDLLIESDQV